MISERLREGEAWLVAEGGESGEDEEESDMVTV